ncbi:DNA-processing protein DprA [Shimazuella sp. AN120528]|uniref:DNA-processing protein DprA n=1 Tax=Shimazuella soli TaxID=1892854 RepID=UPI001F1123A2|nr:DNA-processing protein DprA [Shimazuella soli]MCH5586230.1 DNA-processing protein DprA [Shimazuella soli]
MLRKSLIAVHHLNGVGWSTIRHLFQFGWEGGKIQESILSKLQVKSAQVIRKNWSSSYMDKVLRKLEEKQIDTITIFDDDYPPLLRELPQAPWVLYLLGDRSLLNTKCIAIVGTRKASIYGRKVTEQLSRELSQVNWTVVSGMAAGIDGIAHQSVLAAGGKTIAVLGTGIDEIFPKHHQKLYHQLIRSGLVISEYPPGTPGHPGLFPQRNRIISGLSFGTVVVEAAERSGSLITAEFSMEQGREVFAVPGPIHSQGSKGTLSLIQQGAKCVQSVTDILEELPDWRTEAFTETKQEIAVAIELTSLEQEVWEYLSDEPEHITSLMERITDKMTISDLHSSLLSLEIKGCIAQLPGSHYIKKS